MPYAKPTDKQLSAIAEVVTDRHVHDLGAGDCHLAVLLLLECNARTVTVVDYVLPRDGRRRALEYMLPGDLIFVDAMFEKYVLSKPIDVAFLSWPPNRFVPGLLDLVASARTIIYLGSNADCSACGGLDLLQYFLSRELQRFIPDRQSSLLVLGDVLAQPREPTGEERAGIDGWNGGPVLSFEAAHGKDP
jgi:hypothetical protein